MQASSIARARRKKSRTGLASQSFAKSANPRSGMSSVCALTKMSGWTPASGRCAPRPRPPQDRPRCARSRHFRRGGHDLRPRVVRHRNRLPGVRSLYFASRPPRQRFQSARAKLSKPYRWPIGFSSRKVAGVPVPRLRWPPERKDVPSRFAKTDAPCESGDARCLEIVGADIGFPPIAGSRQALNV